MSPASPSEFTFPLERRIGQRSATAITKHLGIETVGGLLNYFPRRYLKRGELTPIASVPVDEEVTIVARVLTSTTRPMRMRKGRITEITITDGSGGPDQLALTFFNGHRAIKELQPGRQALFSGKVGRYQQHRQLTNPDFDLLPDDEDDEDDEARARMPIPIYPATAKLASWSIRRSVETLLDSTDFDKIEDAIPPHIVQRERFMSLADAYRQIHRPDSIENAARARARFRYQEALILQTALARRRAAAAAEHATARPAVAGALLDQFELRLPFVLTEGQQDVGEVLAAELAADAPMNRLLQGEVGSGKTIVALRAMLQVIDAGGQAALLAPTEVLAAQHYQSITAILGPLAEGGMLGGAADGTQVTLLTGSMPTAARKEAMLKAITGEAGIVIGTHALLSENVQFADLGLIVVDEQHRFGVEQRDLLRSKAVRPPHLLVMTATPIPRTVAMTVFGDLEVSTLTELPAGRTPISTFVVGLAENPAWMRRIWSRAREEIDAGGQIYVVCPKIGEDDTGDFDPDELAALEFAAPEAAGRGSGGSGGPGQDAGNDGGRAARPPASVNDVVERLAGEPALAGTRIGVLHGRLDTAEKSATMAAFNDGKLDLMISTTVIEVGVDVANATLMVIMDADRFGISQLHQLRGRIGRGSRPGTCLLVTSLEPGHPSRTRLDAVAATTDGFLLSQEDLKSRREGDILGASQSGGRSTLRLLRVLSDEHVIETARRDARDIIDDDPELSRRPGLEAAIEQYLNPETEAFLERG